MTLGLDIMKHAILLLLCVLAVGCSGQKPSTDMASGVKTAPPAQAAVGELTTVSGIVPEDDFAMPLIASGILPGSTQGCFLSKETEEAFVALYPKAMAQPERRRSITLKGRVQVVESKPLSAPDAIQMRFKQKVLVVCSWHYTKTGS